MIRVYKLPNDDFNVAYKLRKAVFVDEQSKPIEIEFDTVDERAIHFVVEVDGVPVGCCRVFAIGDNNSCRIGRVCVLPKFRRRGLAAAIVKEVPIQTPFDHYVVHARAYVMQMYKDLGYVQSGPTFEEQGLGTHYKMILSK